MNEITLSPIEMAGLAMLFAAAALMLVAAAAFAWSIFCQADDGEAA
jgi:hypothetical protein